jgi:gamma-glutamyl hydrolase
MPKSWKKYLEEKKVIYFNHNYGISEEGFKKNKLLKEKFRILAEAFDREGRQFVAAIEGKNIPFYGVQFHPEKNS